MYSFSEKSVELTSLSKQLLYGGGGALLPVAERSAVLTHETLYFSRLTGLLASILYILGIAFRAIIPFGEGIEVWMILSPRTEFEVHLLG